MLLEIRLEDGPRAGTLIGTTDDICVACKDCVCGRGDVGVELFCC
jgi:hypothetical protein